jgi:hypothetical protein
MNDTEDIDWDAWRVGEPSPDFVDGVMNAVRRSGAIAPARRADAADARAPISRRRIALSAGAAVVAASLGGYAMVGHLRGARTSELVDGAQTPKDESAGESSRPRMNEAGEQGAANSAHAMGGEGGVSATVINRARRDELRGRLLSPLQARGVERDPHTGFTLPSRSTGPSHNLTEAYIAARVREDFLPLARSCYQNALLTHPTLRGRVVIDFMIVGDAKVGGIVDQAKIEETSDIADPEFATCVRESMLSMVFEPPDNDGWVSVAYPILFDPDDEQPRR